MAIAVDINQVLAIAPNIRSNYQTAFQNGQDFLDTYGISDTALRVSHFMAQILEESGGLAIFYENLNYSPARLPLVWPSRFQPGRILGSLGLCAQPGETG